MVSQTPKLRFTRSLQFRLALGYLLILALLLGLMNTFPLAMTQNIMSRSQQVTLEKQTAAVSSALAAVGSLTPETVAQTLAPLTVGTGSRLLVTDGAGLVLYDSGGGPLGQAALPESVASALRGESAFDCRYSEGVFYSEAAAPVTIWDSVAGAVCLSAEDTDQGALFHELHKDLRLLSLGMCLAVLILLMIFSGLLSRRVNRLLTGIRTVREGEYTYRVSLSGRDELAQLAEEFNQLTDRLQITEEARRRFVSDASHELKTPLTSIRLLTDSILGDETIDRATTREFVEDIGDAADRLIHISEELITLNRLGEDRAESREPVDLNQEVRQIERMLSPLAEEANVTIVTDLRPGCLVLSTPKEMDQVIRNLMENAIKYNVPGGKVTVRTRQQRDTVTLSVSDTGVGIPEEDRARIFDRFYRVDKARSRAAGGNGLGLSIVRDTVLANGGQVRAVPNDGPGVCFTVSLPTWKEGKP